MTDVDMLVRMFMSQEEICEADFYRMFVEPAGVREGQFRGKVYRAKQTIKEQEEMEDGLEHRMRAPSPDVNIRACVFDIETTDFKATGYKGYFLCGVIQPLDADDIIVNSIEYGDVNEDRRALESFVEALSDFTIVIGHYIRGFDLPWIRSRLMAHGLPTPRRWLTGDTYYWARSLKIMAERKSLDALNDFFGLPVDKTRVQARAWHDIRSRQRATFGAAKNHVVEHCIFDVRNNRALLNELWPMMQDLQVPALQRTGW